MEEKTKQQESRKRPKEQAFLIKVLTGRLQQVLQTCGGSAHIGHKPTRREGVCVSDQTRKTGNTCKCAHET